MVDVTILFITHDLDEAVYLSDRVMVLGANPGRVVELIENPVPRPHSPAQFTAPEYLALKARLEHLIHPHVELADEKLPAGRLTRAGGRRRMKGASGQVNAWFAAKGRTSGPSTTDGRRQHGPDS